MITNHLANDEHSSVTPAFTGGMDLEWQVRNKHRHLRYFIQRRIGNGPDVDDLLQATYLEAWKSAHCFRGRSRPDVWLFGIALNLVRGYLKQQRRQRRQERQLQSGFVDVGGGWVGDPGHILEHREHLERLSTAYEKLPDEMKEVFSLVVTANHEYEEAAQVTGVPVGTVRSRLCRARKRMKERAAH